MACQMQRDPTGVDDFLAPADVTVTVCFRSEDAEYELTAATYANQDLDVKNDSTVTFKVIQGRKMLNVTQLSPNAGTIHVVELCDDGTEHELRQRRFSELDGYSIRGTGA